VGEVAIMATVSEAGGNVVEAKGPLTPPSDQMDVDMDNQG